ncbi:MAG TPA: 4'-phosphopantetheinyl transferase superfamily protein [Labilithrix sp.]|nr:4'-phosphopantetheinyl transferase superfamily protein [Labilithrix sp.]
MDPLTPGEVRVWVARPAAASARELARYRALLSAEETERIARFHFERHARESTVSRALVRLMLARFAGAPPESFRYRPGPYGRPQVEPPCGVWFNATNHPELVACAVALTEEIGVDVEPLARADEILEVAGTVFSPPELESLALLPDGAARRDRAVSLWTCKEAYIKARGLGFSAPLKEIVVEFPAGERPTIRFLSATDQSAGWWLDQRDLHGVRLAIAVRASAEPRLVVEELETSP